MKQRKTPETQLPLIAVLALHRQKEVSDAVAEYLYLLCISSVAKDFSGTPENICGKLFSYEKSGKHGINSGADENLECGRDGVNWYSYTGGNPIGMVDPLGLNTGEALTSWGTNGEAPGDVTIVRTGGIGDSGNHGSTGGSTDKQENDRVITEKGNQYTYKNANGEMIEVITIGFQKLERPVKDKDKTPAEKSADKEQETAKSADAEADRIVSSPIPDGTGQRMPGADRPSDGSYGNGNTYKDELYEIGDKAGDFGDYVEIGCQGGVIAKSGLSQVSSVLSRKHIVSYGKGKSAINMLNKFTKGLGKDLSKLSRYGKGFGYLGIGLLTLDTAMVLDTSGWKAGFFRGLRHTLSVGVGVFVTGVVTWGGTGATFGIGTPAAALIGTSLGYGASEIIDGLLKKQGW